MRRLAVCVLAAVTVLDRAVLQTANPVVVHPDALGEAAMAARTTAVLRAG